LDVESKVQKKKEVTNIKYSTSSTTDKVTVTCSDGTTYTADHVIFTASLGVLKARHATLFTPRLPAVKVKAIENIGFGTLGKIFLEFDAPFWSLDAEKFVAYSFLWTDEHLKNVKSTDRAWLTDINNFIRVDGFPNLLETLVAGRRIGEFEAFNDTKVTDDVMWLLETFLGKKLPKPKSMRRTSWQKSKNFLGSYSFHSMATAANKVSPRHLAQSIVNPVNKPIILFAGEATDEKFSSYAHGAVASGWRAGNELVAFLNKK
jgi:monoamine oxidase